MEKSGKFCRTCFVDSSVRWTRMSSWRCLRRQQADEVSTFCVQELHQIIDYIYYNIDCYQRAHPRSQWAVKIAVFQSISRTRWWDSVFAIFIFISFSNSLIPISRVSITASRCGLLIYNPLKKFCSALQFKLFMDLKFSWYLFFFKCFNRRNIEKGSCIFSSIQACHDMHVFSKNKSLEITLILWNDIYWLLLL